MSSHYNKSDFMQFLIEKCHFGNKKTKWACYWVERFEQLFPEWEQDREHAIEAFNDLLCKRKSDIVVNWALQSVRVFMMYVSVNSTPLSVIKHHNGEQIFSVWQILAMFRQNKVKELRFIL